MDVYFGPANGNYWLWTQSTSFAYSFKIRPSCFVHTIDIMTEIEHLLLLHNLVVMLLFHLDHDKTCAFLCKSNIKCWAKVYVIALVSLSVLNMLFNLSIIIEPRHDNIIYNPKKLQGIGDILVPKYGAGNGPPIVVLMVISKDHQWTPKMNQN